MREGSPATFWFLGRRVKKLRLGERLLKKFRIGVIFGPQDLKDVALISWLLRNGDCK